MKRLYGVLLLAGLLVISVTGCPPRTAGNTGSNERVAGSEEQVMRVNVSMTEFAFKLDPNTAPAGDVVFEVKNDGKAVHVFEIEGQGIEEETSRMQPGETATLRINNLKPGTYKVYCPVGNHEDRGMKTAFMVTEN